MTYSFCVVVFLLCHLHYEDRLKYVRLTRYESIRIRNDLIETYILMLLHIPVGGGQERLVVTSVKPQDKISVDA